MSVDTELTRAAQNAASVNAAKAAIASAITAKGGTVGVNDGLEDFPAAISAIPSGGTDYTQYITNGSSLFANSEGLPETMIVNLERCSTLNSTFAASDLGTSDRTLKHLTVTPLTSAVAFSSFCSSQSVLETVVFTRPIKPKSMTNAFNSCPSLISITGGIDMTEASATNNWQVFNGASLVTLEFVPNTLSVNWEFRYGAFSDMTLVNIGNALNQGSPHTLTLKSAYKTAITGIMGTVSQVTDGGATYDVFTAAESGDTSLEDFITLVKGWTIA